MRPASRCAEVTERSGRQAALVTKNAHGNAYSPGLLVQRFQSPCRPTGTDERSCKTDCASSFGGIQNSSDNKELPLPENGSMCFMMSKQQYFGDKEGNGEDSHLMFWFPQREHVDWGAEADDSPVNVHQFSPQPITEFTISTSKWSDGTPVSAN
jgi:hypothetical protein